MFFSRDTRFGNISVKEKLHEKGILKMNIFFREQGLGNRKKSSKSSLVCITPRVW